MKKFIVISSLGVSLGVYEGECAEEALNAMARDAGYHSQKDAPSPFDGTVEEVEELETDEEWGRRMIKQGDEDPVAEEEFQEWIERDCRAREEIADLSDRYNTSRSVIHAIVYLTCGNYREFVRVWNGDCDESTIGLVFKAAKKAMDIYCDDYPLYWGLQHIDEDTE